MGNNHQNLGRLEQITNLRDVWSDEARDFTPWLAQEVNIRLLGDSIGMDLEVQSVEKAVGPFSADILCTDQETDAYVLIENQLARTDHKHLGQLMTYAAGLEAVTIVWIADTFTEEHRAALDWLNDKTSDDLNFFGLEIELWRIGDSPVAPKFNVVSKPNEWTHSVKDSVSSREHSEIQLLQLEFWKGFREYIPESSPIRPRKARPQHWSNMAIGKTGFTLTAIAITNPSELRMELKVKNKAYFSQLEDDRESIDQELGCEVAWRTGKSRKIDIISVRSPADILNQGEWQEYYAWLFDQIKQFHRVFANRIQNLSEDEMEPTDSED